MQLMGFHFCGGSIISKDVILTAAHCTIYATKQMSVRVGSSIRETGGIVHRVKDAVRHEKYDTNSYGSPVNDLALLRLESVIEFGETTRIVGLFDQDEEAVDGTISTISGWGTTIDNGVEHSEVLRAVDVFIVSKTKCYEAYLQEFNGIPERQICAGFPEGGKDTCQGDSGGPLVIKGRQAGIVSWGNGCARKGYPGVYTEVASYRNWIDENLNL